MGINFVRRWPVARASAKQSKPRKTASRKKAAKAAAQAPPRTVMEPLGLRTKEAMAVLNCGEVTLHKLLRTGQLRSSKIGGMRIVHVESIRKLLADTATP
jgi:hypothetical protein